MLPPGSVSDMVSSCHAVSSPPLACSFPRPIRWPVAEPRKAPDRVSTRPALGFSNTFDPGHQRYSPPQLPSTRDIKGICRDIKGICRDIKDICRRSCLRPGTSKVSAETSKVSAGTSKIFAAAATFDPGHRRYVPTHQRYSPSQTSWSTFARSMIGDALTPQQLSAIGSEVNK